MNLFIDLCGVAVLCCSLLFIYSICMIVRDDGINFEKIAMFSFVGLLISTALYVGLLPFYDNSESMPVTVMESTAPEDYGRISGKSFIHELKGETTFKSDSYCKPVERIWTKD